MREKKKYQLYLLMRVNKANQPIPFLFASLFRAPLLKYKADCKCLSADWCLIDVASWK